MTNSQTLRTTHDLMVPWRRQRNGCEVCVRLRGVSDANDCVRTPNATTGAELRSRFSCLRHVRGGSCCVARDPAWSYRDV